MRKTVRNLSQDSHAPTETRTTYLTKSKLDVSALSQLAQCDVTELLQDYTHNMNTKSSDLEIHV